MSVWRVFTLAALLLLLAACASGAPDSGEASMKRDPSQRVSKHQPLHRPTIALVLGGGGVRGFAHVGAIQALEEAGIAVDAAGQNQIVVAAGANAAARASALDGLAPSPRDILLLQLRDTEEDHAWWLEQQLGLIQRIGLEPFKERVYAEALA